MQEQADTSEALLLSKAGSRSADGALLARLSLHNPEVVDRLLSPQRLRECFSRVELANCEVRPAWASGALLLMPLTEEQVLK